MLSDIASKRLEICKACPLYTEKKSGAICDSKKYMNAEGDWSYFKKDEYKPGCGCVIEYKVSILDTFCPHHKWGVFYEKNTK